MYVFCAFVDKTGEKMAITENKQHNNIDKLCT